MHLLQSLMVRRFLGKTQLLSRQKVFFLSALQSSFELLDSTAFTESSTKEAVWDYATETGRGAVLWPLRYTLSGKDKSPDPFSIAEAIGKDETLKRIEKAIEML